MIPYNTSHISLHGVILRHWKNIIHYMNSYCVLWIHITPYEVISRLEKCNTACKITGDQTSLLSQTIYHWQEIFFFLTLTSDTKVILQWYHCIVCELNRTIERVVFSNLTCLVLFFFWFRSHARCICCT